jgi:hypothetical protein
LLPRSIPEILKAEVDREVKYDNIDASQVAAAIATGGASLLVPIPRRYERPDLQWSLYVGSARAYRSPAIQDAYSAAWASSSTPVRLAPGDRFSICLEDEDIGASERIACFDFTPDSYAEQAKSGKPLSGKAVKKLVLGAPLLSK